MHKIDIIRHKNGKNACFTYASEFINVSTYVANYLSSFGGKVYERDILDHRTGKIYHQTQYKSYTNPLITKEYHRWYKHHIKHVPTDLKLTPLVCLIWYLGDGCLVHHNNSNQQHIKLATHCFTKEEQERVLIPQLQNFEAKLVKAGVKKSTNETQYAIIIPRRHIQNFLNYIGECPLIEYRYKWDYHEYIYNKPVAHRALESDFVNAYLKDPTLSYYAIAKKFKVQPGVVKYYLMKHHLYTPRADRSKIYVNVVIQYFQGNAINIFYSAAEAAKFLKRPTSSGIIQACNGKQQSAYGFEWKKFIFLSETEKQDIQNQFVLFFRKEETNEK